MRLLHITAVHREKTCTSDPMFHMWSNAFLVLSVHEGMAFTTLQVLLDRGVIGWIKSHNAEVVNKDEYA